MVERFVEWTINTDDEFDVLVQWRGHDDDDERTWEPLDRAVSGRCPRAGRETCPSERASPVGGGDLKKYN